MPRDSSGNYSLPVGNPIVSGTTPSSTTMNATLADIAAAIQDSLSRSGYGGMLVSFQFGSGTINNPGITFSSDTTTGIRLNANGDIRITVSAADALTIIGTAATFAGTVTIAGVLSVASSLSFTGTGTNTITSHTSDTGTQIAFKLNTSGALTTASRLLLSVQNNGTGLMNVDALGNVYMGADVATTSYGWWTGKGIPRAYGMITCDNSGHGVLYGTEAHRGISTVTYATNVLTINFSMAWTGGGLGGGSDYLPLVMPAAGTFVTGLAGIASGQLLVQKYDMAGALANWVNGDAVLVAIL